MKKETVTAIKEQSEEITKDLRAAAACLEVIANSLFFAEDRKDKDMTKPAAVCIEIVGKIVSDCIEATEGIAWEIDRDGKGAA